MLSGRTCRLVLVLAAVGLLASACSSGDGVSATSAASPSAPSAVLAASRAFLAHYVTAEGRVVRRDQGGDTVSEGQAYALLVATAIGAESQLSRIWAWTHTHLEQPSGLLASRWADGRVVDSSGAADADSQAAWALALAGSRFHRTDWTGAARRLGIAVADHEIGYDDAGTPVLAAGPWAARPNTAVTVEPGYWTPPATRTLAALTGDKRWRDLVAAQPRQLARLTDDGQTLPPDWAQTRPGNTFTAIAAPSGGAPVQSGPDGLRALVWSAVGGERPLATRWWSLLSGTATAAPLARGLDGRPSVEDRSALSAVSAAAVAHAAGHGHACARLLDLADRIDATYPSYYGAAWAALGRILLTTTLLTG